MKDQRLVSLATFSQPQYLLESPLLIEACALYLDRIGNACVAQIKWRNIGDKTVKAVLIKLLCFDTFGQKIDERDYQYDRLSAEPGVEFGAKSAIVLNNSKTAKYQVMLKAIRYDDGFIWQAESTLFFTELPKSTEHPFTGKLLAQYKRDLLQEGFETDVKFETQKKAGLWQCACGSWQRDGYPCLACGVTETILHSLADMPELEQRLKVYEERQRVLRLKQLQKKRAEERRRKRIGLSIAGCLAVCIVFACSAKFYFIPKHYYDLAEDLEISGKYDEASAAFKNAGNYSDAVSRINELYYKQAEAFEVAGDKARAIMAYNKANNAENAQTRITALWNEIADRNVISAGYYYTIGLKSDGTVVAVGENDYSQCDVGTWTDIVAVSAGYYHTVGLKSDGSVVAVGYNGSGEYDVNAWTDIVAVSAGSRHTVGLKSDGTVVAVGRNNYSQCDVGTWTDIVAVSAGYSRTIGLKSDGTVVAVGWNRDGQCDVDAWTDIVAVSAGKRHTVGLKSDGTVVAVGEKDDGQCDVGTWTNIVAVSAGDALTIGLKSDGTVVAVGSNYFGQCNVGAWRLKKATRPQLP